MDADRASCSAGRRARSSRRQVDRNLAKARTKTSLKALSKLTHLVDGEPRIVSDPPLIVPVEELAPPEAARPARRPPARAHPRLPAHAAGRPPALLERFRYVHAARKVVGVGSVGTRAWIVLLLGRDDSDPLFLQAKQAEASVLEPFLGKSTFSHHGQRVVEGQQLTQAASDIMLGWLRASGVDGVDRDFYVRQLWDAKGSAVVETMTPKSMTEYAQVCGWALAKGHARSGDAIAIASYLGPVRRARPGAGRVRRDVRGPERARLRRAAGRRGIRPRQGRDRPLISATLADVGSATNRLETVIAKAGPHAPAHSEGGGPPMSVVVAEEPVYDEGAGSR